MGVLFYVVLLLAVVLALLLVALLHAGFFYELRIRTSTPLSCPKRVAYKLYTGPYKNCGSYFRQLISLAPTLKTFGVYYDDPDKVSNQLYTIQYYNYIKAHHPLFNTIQYQRRSDNRAPSINFC